MRVLVTGATGFVGSHLCRALAAAGFGVTACRRMASDTGQLHGLPLQFREIDFDNPETVERAVRGHDFVVHAAANIRYSSADRDLERVNVEGTRTVARACRAHGTKRLVHVSSMSAIGVPRRGIVADEEFPFNLEGSGLSYGLSKKRAEEAVFEEVARGLDAVVVNPTSIFGPHGRTYRGGEMIYKVRRSVIVPYFSGGICTVHVDDVAAGIVAAMECGRSGERYILGGENMTYREIARSSAEAQGLKRILAPVPKLVTAVAARVSRLPYASHYMASRFQFYSSDKAARLLGYGPRPFAAILDECLVFAGHGAARTAAAAPQVPDEFAR